MSLARAVLLKASRSQFLANNLMRRGFARRAVRRFMPGETLDAALDAAASLAGEGLGTVVTQLGENLTTLAEAEKVCEHYVGAFDAIAARRLPAWPSVKPTQLGLDLSFDACLAHLETLAAKADAQQSLLWIDMEDSSYVDRTIELFRRLRARHERVGIALQAYLRRTPADLAALLPLKPVIRLVKGAYMEPEHVAFPVKRDVDLAYYELGVKLLEAAANGGAFPVFGTHDIALAMRLASRASQLGVKDGQFEIHMLYGIRAADQRALAAQGRKVKVLISYGSAWFPWYMRRLAERPANVWFVVKSLVA
jgi:proline dehydrogenase